MKISRKSWHYRLCCYTLDDSRLHCYSICEYVILSFITIFIILPLKIIALGVIFGFACAFYPFVWMAESYQVYRREKQERDEGKPLGYMGLVWEWVKAKKRKVCPLIEWED